MLNVLVTGAGNGVGQSIIKSLNISKYKLNVIAADINLFSSGLYRSNKCIFCIQTKIQLYIYCIK